MSDNLKRAGRPNIYQPFFGPPPDIYQRTCVTDWSRHAVDVPYLFFITGRCGSTWLAHLLEDSGICGAPHEFFNEGMLASVLQQTGTTSLSQYLESIIVRHRAGRRFGMQVDGWRLSHLEQYLDFDCFFPHANRVVFWMTREDLVGQAHSFIMAKATGRWHVYRGVTPPVSSADDRVIDDKSMWDEIFFILSQEQRMEEWFAAHSIKPYRLTYEQLVANRHALLMRVMGLLGCGPDAIEAHLRAVEDRTVRMSYDHRYSYLSGFVSRYMPSLERIYEERNRIDLNQLRREMASIVQNNNQGKPSVQGSVA